MQAYAGGNHSIGGIHKPCGQWKGEGGSQMFIFILHKPYFVKCPRKGEGAGSEMSKKTCPHGLWMTPVHRHIQLSSSKFFQNDLLAIILITY